MPGQTLSTNLPTTTLLADVTALIARVVIGASFILHGMQKVGMGVDGTAQMFAAMGIPMPQVAAIVAIAIEVGGGVALLIGFALPVAGVALALQMAGAIVFYHLAEGHAFVAPAGEPSFELAAVMGVAALALGFTGARLAVDRWLPWGRQAQSVGA
ncbi:putative oxidoreductase [Nocardiopsis mwathae]|uniref:Putative oxidoreductase n=1 Tax=Nocardiopsis mwathae TaxID=1472723 RepID=A0A7W9YFI4_9ACTN|nr:DoxX family protein [Nocardiopsis mwathae]MBB6171142.1 putative oxidoreductase [Nocardiopsis mwathae]